MRATVLALSAVLAAAAIAPASATVEDSVHADSFGNLVIYSPAGYKRIVVGVGEAASGYRATGSYYAQDAAPRGSRGETLYLRPVADCAFGAVLVHGRSYMYGLPHGVVPTPGRSLCR